ncbi:Outer membrane protein (porin) [Paraburkholderia fungorum]|uniref:Outer membrane protein (Porin) n=1 Tax=Paraburkholderia fungorum TaxID=134537 RepID=A0A1H1K012_9BURK|nr:porin [Paraburkholderia fungorum]SDR55402.1 Outer membrane protein (porin) [Paraburkholderia fungorum]
MASVFVIDMRARLGDQRINIQQSIGMMGRLTILKFELENMSKTTATTMSSKSVTGIFWRVFFPASIFAFVCAPVHAQSSVTLYGIVAEGIGYITNQGGKSVVGMYNGLLQNSRFGIRGKEDLGGGNSAIFLLENGFSVTTGALSSGKLFGRQAWVGLSNDKFGKITLGRQYDEMSQQLWWSEASTQFATAIATHIGDLDNIFNTTRLDNSIRYASRDYDGFTFAGQYAFSNSTAFSDNSGYSLGANYVRGSLTAGVAMVQLLHPASSNTGGAVGDTYGFTSPFTQSLSGSSVDSQRNVAAAVTYDFGWATTGLSYSNVLFNYQNSTGLRLQNVEFMAYRHLTRTLLVGVGYDYTFGSYSTGQAIHYNQINLGAIYSLSKRTDLFLAAIYQRAGGAAKHAQLYSLSPSSSRSIAEVATGIRVKF